MDNQPIQPQPVLSSPQTQAQPPVINSAKPTKKSKLPIVMSLLAIVLIAGAAYGVYAWQHSKVTKLNSQITALTNKSTAQTNKTAELNNQLSKTNQSSSQSSKSTTLAKSPYDQTAAITQAVKAYKDNVQAASQASVIINGVTASGNAAYGSVTLPGGGGGSWLAINSSGNWSVVSQGQVGVCKSQSQQYSLPSVWVTDSDC